MRPHTRRLAAGVLAAGLLLGCGGEAEDPQLMQESDEAASPSERPTSEATSRGEGYLDVDTDLTQEHPSGVVIEIEAVRFDGASILLDGRVRNEGDADAVFPVAAQPERLRLVDDQGGTYDYLHPQEADVEEDETVTVPPGETLEGPFGFAGPAAEDAGSLRLAVNVADPEAFDPGQRDAGSERPAFVLEPVALETFD